MPVRRPHLLRSRATFPLHMARSTMGHKLTPQPDCGGSTLAAIQPRPPACRGAVLVDSQFTVHLCSVGTCGDLLPVKARAYVEWRLIMAESQVALNFACSTSRSARCLAYGLSERQGYLLLIGPGAFAPICWGFAYRGFPGFRSARHVVRPLDRAVCQGC